MYITWYDRFARSVGLVDGGKGVGIILVCHDCRQRRCAEGFLRRSTSIARASSLPLDDLFQSAFVHGASDTFDAHLTPWLNLDIFRFDVRRRLNLLSCVPSLPLDLHHLMLI